jgi:hypothetical protein
VGDVYSIYCLVLKILSELLSGIGSASIKQSVEDLIAVYPHNGMASIWSLSCSLDTNDIITKGFYLYHADTRKYIGTNDFFGK